MLYFIIAALVVMLDQTVKYFVSLNLTPGISQPFIPGLIRLTYTENTGAAFSFLSDMRWILVVVSAIVIVMIIIFMIRYKDKVDPIGRLALAAILGGAFSHLFDRAVFGYVVDFFEFEFVRFAIFDVADIFITVGGIVFCIYYLATAKKHDDLRQEFMLGKRKKTETQTADTGTTGSVSEDNDDAGQA